MSKSIPWWVGLDTHANSIQGVGLRGWEEEAREEFEIVPDARGLGKLVKKLQELSEGVRCVYEAGPCG